jgi:hypothetical protein
MARTLASLLAATTGYDRPWTITLDYQCVCFAIHAQLRCLCPRRSLSVLEHGKVMLAVWSSLVLPFSRIARCERLLAASSYRPSASEQTSAGCHSIPRFPDRVSRNNLPQLRLLTLGRSPPPFARGFYLLYISRLIPILFLRVTGRTGEVRLSTDLTWLGWPVQKFPFSAAIRGSSVDRREH